jgi:DNA-binding NarL/FixJ family response regulator
MAEVSKETVTTASTVRVLCVDDHPLLLEGVVRKVERQPDMIVVGTAGTGQEAVMQYVRHRPDVVLMDLQMPGMSGLQAIEAIRREDPQAKIVVLTILGGDEDIFRAIRAGAASYLLKSSLSQDLIATIRRVFAGERPMPPDVAERLAMREGQSGLSTREVEILELIAKGLRNKEIAATLGIGQETVQTHIKRLFVKLQVSDRTAAVTVALGRGIVHMP